MPTPRKGEKKKDFIERCMGHSHTQKYHPDQRYKVCESFWKKGKKRKGESK